MGVIAIPKPLRERLGDEGTDAFVEVIKEIDLDARKDSLSLAEERFEKRLTQEIGKLNERLTQEMGKLNERIVHLEARVRLYFVVLLFVIIIASPKTFDLLAKLLGIIK